MRSMPCRAASSRNTGARFGRISGMEREAIHAAKSYRFGVRSRRPMPNGFQAIPSRGTISAVSRVRRLYTKSSTGWLRFISVNGARLRSFFSFIFGRPAVLPRSARSWTERSSSIQDRPNRWASRSPDATSAFTRLILMPKRCAASLVVYMAPPIRSFPKIIPNKE